MSLCVRVRLIGRRCDSMTAGASIYDIRHTYTSTCMYLYVSLSGPRPGAGVAPSPTEFHETRQTANRRACLGCLPRSASLGKGNVGLGQSHGLSRAHSLTGISFLFGRRDSHHTLAFSSLSPTEAQAEASCGKMRSRSRIPTSKRTRGKESARSRTVARDRSKGGGGKAKAPAG